LNLVPELAVRNKFGLVPVTIPRELADDFPWWSEVQPPEGFGNWIDAILPETKSWSSSMRLWGSEQEHGDTAFVCYDDQNGSVESIGFRIDVRQISTTYIENICLLANRLRCLVLTGTYRLLKPKTEAIMDAIKNSTANKFVQDPVSTLMSLKLHEGDVISFPKRDCPD
jgi:hypothetical protein